MIAWCDILFTPIVHCASSTRSPGVVGMRPSCGKDQAGDRRVTAGDGIGHVDVEVGSIRTARLLVHTPETARRLDFLFAVLGTDLGTKYGESDANKRDAVKPARRAERYRVAAMRPSALGETATG